MVKIEKGDDAMNFNEAKERKDYDFRIHNAIVGYRKELIDRSFSWWCEEVENNGVAEWGIAVLEIGWVDIELNIGVMCNDDGTGYINKPDPVYFICVKGRPTSNETGWCDGGYLDNFGYVVNVDWSSDNWLEQLEKDMFDNLMKAVKEFNLKIDEPNWEGVEHEFDVFDRIHGIRR